MVFLSKVKVGFFDVFFRSTDFNAEDLIKVYGLCGMEEFD